MITKNDCLILLSDLQDRFNIEVPKKYIQKVLLSDQVSVEVVQYINSQRQLDLSNFYQKIRKSYNNKKSNLYINIVKEITDPDEVVITLSAMLTQILLFSKSVDNKLMCLRHARADDISKVLSIYFTTFNVESCIKLLQLIKADLKVLEDSLVQD